MDASRKAPWALLVLSLLLIVAGLVAKDDATVSAPQPEGTSPAGPHPSAPPITTAPGHYDDSADRQADAALQCLRFTDCALNCGEGKMVTIDPQGKRERVCLQGETPHGMAFAFFQDGRRQQVKHYVHGQLHGQQILFFRNGRRAGIRHHQNGQLHGLFVDYKNQATNQPALRRRQRQYSRGKQLGLERTWHDNGVLYSEYYWQDDKREGTARKWQPNGRLKWQGHYRNGFLEGTATAWQPNGQRWIERQFRRGKANGLARRWHANGHRSTWTWLEGKLNGPHQIWYQDGRQKAQGSFRNGERDGTLRTWDSEGDLQTHCIYEQGRLLQSISGRCQP